MLVIVTTVIGIIKIIYKIRSAWRACIINLHGCGYAMGSQVRLQIRKLSKRLITIVELTLVGPIARVSSSMLPQMTQLSEPF